MQEFGHNFNNKSISEQRLKIYDAISKAFDSDIENLTANDRTRLIIFVREKNEFSKKIFIDDSFFENVIDKAKSMNHYLDEYSSNSLNICTENDENYVIGMTGYGRFSFCVYKCFDLSEINSTILKDETFIHYREPEHKIEIKEYNSFEDINNFHLIEKINILESIRWPSAVIDYDLNGRSFSTDQLLDPRKRINITIRKMENHFTCKLYTVGNAVYASRSAILDIEFNDYGIIDIITGESTFRLQAFKVYDMNLAKFFYYL